MNKNYNNPLISLPRPQQRIMVSFINKTPLGTSLFVVRQRLPIPRDKRKNSPFFNVFAFISYYILATSFPHSILGLSRLMKVHNLAS
eukprot:24413_4